jgi:hypothetical protein
VRRFGLLSILVLVGLVAACGREHMLPRPEPLAVHAGRGLSEGEQKRLADIRRFLSPFEQEVLEQTLRNLAEDPRLPAGEVDAALKRALSGFGSASGFCDRLARELRPLALTGPLAQAPAKVALAVPIDTAHARWLSEEGRERYPDAPALARALRDAEFEKESVSLTATLGPGGRPLFVTDAAEFEKRGPSAARRLCLSGPPAASYVLALIPSSALPAPLRVPTAADAVCRPKFVLPAPHATAGVTCTGRPEYATAPVGIAAVSEFRLTR